MAFLIVSLYFAVLLLLCLFGAHRAHLVWLWFRSRAQVNAFLEQARLETPQALPASLSLQAASLQVAASSGPVALASVQNLPRVTVQLPLYNEATVVERLLDAATRLDYPRELLQIQVLDDSTDETRLLAARRIAQLAATGINIEHIRRPDRVGYKAGALDFGLGNASGELIAMFDADFIPQPEFLRSVVGHFSDPSVAMVQTRWSHLNREESLLTRVQALLLDGHHLVENQARFGNQRLFNFSGTGGIWRRTAIEDAGGWQHDTLTEDLDLSYRAQLKGWKFIYRPDITTPSELPNEMSALRAQQYRWAKGTVQCARKLLQRVWRSDLSLAQRIEASFHLTPHFSYPLMMLLSVLILPAVLLIPAGSVGTMLALDLPLCLGATGSIGLYFSLAERLQGRSSWSAISRLPAIIALGAGLSPLITRAVISGLRGMAGEFVRTPKRGDSIGRYRQRVRLPWAELTLAAISSCSVIASIQTEHWFATPFTFLFASGYWYVAGQLVLEQLQQREEVPRLVTSI